EVAELLSAGFLEPFEIARDFCLESRSIELGFPCVGRTRSGTPQVRDADVARDGEPRRHRHAEVRHFREVCALSAEDNLHVLCALGAAVTEEVDGLAHDPVRVVSIRSRNGACPDRLGAGWDSLRRSTRDRNRAARPEPTTACPRATDS